MERGLIFFLFFAAFALAILPLANADITSQNSGGTGNIILNPNQLVENFFFGGEQAGPVCGNGIVETGEQCDDGNTVSGDGCSATCQIESITPPSTGGGGGGTTQRIAVSPTNFNVNLAVNTTTERTITITNIGSSTTTVPLNQQGLSNHILFENNSVRIAPGETVHVKVTFVALSDTGIFTGKINVGSQEILVSLNVKTKLLLFDSNIVVLNHNYQVSQGDKLRTRVTLIPMGDQERLDVNLNYVIKDYSGNVYLTKTETMLVDSQVQVDRNFDTGKLPLGNYVIGLTLVYPNGVAPSSAHFEVTTKAPINIFVRILIVLIILILMVLIAIMIIMIIRRLRQRRLADAMKPPKTPSK